MRKNFGLTFLLLWFLIALFTERVLALEGAGPADVYGGPSENRNICTPYHFVPADRLTLKYPWKAGPNLLETEPQNLSYWTQGNNISQSVAASGAYWLGATSGGWQQRSLACIYPRGSAFKMIRSQCIFEHCIGEFNAREPKDTISARYLGGSQRAGRIPTDMGYRDDLEPWADKYTGKTDRLHVSTRPSDVEEWPDEFRDENGEPLIISDEDVVVVHWIGGGHWSSDLEQQDARARPLLEMPGRVMSFSASIARDIQFYDYKLINKSQFHYFPDVGPYDIEEYMFGPGAIFSMGDQTGGQKVAFVPALHFGFTYEETFTDPAISPPSPLGGFAILRRLETRDPETGELEEGRLVSFSMKVSGGSWGYYHDEMSSTKAWLVRMGDPKFLYLQDPGFGDDPESMLPIISRGSGSEYHFRYSSDNPLCPGDTAYLAYALVCAFPSVGDPASMATSPEGLAQVAAKLLENAAMAQSLYDGGFKMPRPPVVPNVRLIPGDHQVTITWDNLSEFSRDEFYDQYLGTNDYKEYDFEGYRVYRSTSGESSDAHLLAQFDMRNGVVMATGIRNEQVTVVDEEGNEADAYTTTYTDTLGISDYDPPAGARFGMGQDTGLRYSFIDRYEERVDYGKKATNQHRLTNGFRYFYAVTAYDWNGTDFSDLTTMNSLESPLVFGSHNMAVPGSNPSSYRQALITDELTEIPVLDGSGNLLDTRARDIRVEAMALADEAVVTNGLSDPFIFVVNPELITSDADYYIVIDSIVGEPSDLENPEVTSGYDYKLMNRVYVSLLDESGRVLSTDEGMIKCDNGPFAGHGAHFVLYPDPVQEKGIPFNVEFDIPSWDTELMVWNDIEVISGSTPLEDIEIKHGYNSGNNSFPTGYRAADLELRWQDTGDDSLTLEVWDVTHNVEIGYNRLIGSSWSFYSSWSRFGRLSSVMRSELTEDNYTKAGTHWKASKLPKKAGKPVKMDLYVCGMQVKVATDESTVPRSGDVWRIRSNYGTMPADSVGYLSQRDGDGNPLKRPPVAGVRYELRVTDDSNRPEDADLGKIRVVPNPYIVADQWDRSTQEKRLAFTSLPMCCSIRIYTLSGNLVQVLSHEGRISRYDHFWKGGTEFWDMKNRYNMLVSSGWYIYHVKDLATGDTQMGRFAIIQ